MRVPTWILTAALLGCGAHEDATTSHSADSKPTARRHARVNVTHCTPAGFGFSCVAEVDGTPATLEACVGSGDTIGLTPKVAPPVVLSVDVESAPDTARYCGILILPAGDHLKIVGVQ